MALDGEQQVREIAQHMRPDGLALETAGDAEHRHFVDRDREVIGPKVGEALNERPIRRHRCAHACSGLLGIDRSIELADLHDRGGIGILFSAAAARVTPLAAQLERLRQYVSRAAQLFALQARRSARQLRGEPAPRIACYPRKLTRPGSEPKAVCGDCGG